MNKITLSMVEIIKEAAEIMTTAVDIENKTEEKGERNFVTEYDVKVQSFLKDKLSHLLPEAVFLGEEGECKADPYKGYCFICDPIDGTANFRRSYKHSAISLALALNGEIVSAAVINPWLCEVFYAEKGQGAYMNGKKISVSSRDLEHSFVAFGTSPYYPELAKKTIEMLGEIVPITEDIRRVGTAALDLCYVANGRNDMFFELSLFPWDYAAASLIITEAGGIITDSAQNMLPLHKRTSVYAGNKFAYHEFFNRKLNR